jgi:shikimate dehydrogenase
MQDTIRLGLIGDNIAASHSPRLHVLAGAQIGVRVVYDLIVPRERGKPFEAVLGDAATQGYRGVNVTYPYKERAAGLVRIDDPLVRAIGSVNTILFGQDAPRGFNTDHSGFVTAYCRARGSRPTGAVVVVGAGGVGKAIAFALARLGCRELRIADTDGPKAEALLAAVRAAFPDLGGVAGADAMQMSGGAAGLINCTPIGMIGHDGSPLPAEAMSGADWAFDAVYTPPDTQFLRDAQAAGLQAIFGYELFLAQGIDAWALFTGLPVDKARLEADLRARFPHPD